MSCVFPESDTCSSLSSSTCQSTCPLPNVEHKLVSLVNFENINHCNSKLSNDCFSTLIQNDSLIQTDQDEDISVYSYANCNEKSDTFLQNCRGLVFLKDELISRLFPFTREISCSDDLSMVCDNFDQFKFYTSYEGAIIRVMHVKGEWKVTTNKKLNAYASRWGSSESFGDEFKKGA